MSLFSNRSKNKGFTLIELLVVIAIIGILASVVLASLNSARQKSRDTKRIADLKNIQLALELYFDSNTSYAASIQALVDAEFLPALPTDPTGAGGGYQYAIDTAGLDYHLGATLEAASAGGVLGSDSDFDSAAASWTGGFNGSVDAGACNEAAGDDTCYDLKP